MTDERAQVRAKKLAIQKLLAEIQSLPQGSLEKDTKKGEYVAAKVDLETVRPDRSHSLGCSHGVKLCCIGICVAHDGRIASVLTRRIGQMVAGATDLVVAVKVKEAEAKKVARQQALVRSLGCTFRNAGRALSLGILYKVEQPAGH